MVDVDIDLFDMCLKKSFPDHPSIGSPVREQLLRHVKGVVALRSQVNLVGTDSLEEVVKRHTADSLHLSALSGLPAGGRWADVGTGGGFPGLVFALSVPTVEILLIETKTRKREALQKILSDLIRHDSALKDRVRLDANRAEELGQEESVRDRLDGVVCRALAPFPVALELCLPLVRPGGIGVFFKGARFQEECAQASVALEELGGRIERVSPYRLETDGISRALVVVSKVCETPARYPRRVGVPGRRPLGS
jgi:16S rRNA (guanine527-N7)-methyltransferase